MKETESGYKFESTGREFYANGYIGIDPDLNIAQGYDGLIYPEPENEDDVLNLKPEERIELADYMIDLWTKFKQKVK